jgi:hypothetical protein
LSGVVLSRAAAIAGPHLALVTALAIGAAPLAGQQKVPLVLNHLVIVLDSATFADLKGSPFLSTQFAATDLAGGGLFDPVRSGVRLYGKYNYVVFSGPPTLANLPSESHTLLPGQFGLVLGAERAPATGINWAITMVCNDVCGANNIDSDVGTQAPHWLGDSTSGFTWYDIAQFSASGARRLAVKDSLPESNRTNVRFLAPWFDSKKLFSHLTSATFAIPVDQIKQVVAQLRLHDVAIVADGEGAIIKLDGFTLHLIPPYRGAGVKQLQFALTHAAPANPTYRFGPKSQLRFGPGLIAVWDFEPK